MIIVTYFLNLISIFFIGFICNYFIFNLIIKGYISTYLQLILLDKFSKNDFKWLNNTLILLIFLYIIIDMNMLNNIIYLDNDTMVNVNLDGVKLSVSGDYLNQIYDKYGSVAVFGVGARIAASFVSKGNMSLLGKIGTVIGAGASSTFTFNITSMTSEKIKGIILAKKMNSNVMLEIKNVEILNSDKTPLNLTNISDHNLIPRMELRSNETLISKFSNLFQNKINLIETPDKKSIIIETIEKYNAKTINEIFTLNDNNQIMENSIYIEPNLINSPLEQNEFLMSEIKNYIIEILNYDFALHFVMIYFILMLIFLFTIKIIIDKKISFEIVKSLPLGKYIHFIITKIISIWKNSIIF